MNNIFGIIKVEKVLLLTRMYQQCLYIEIKGLRGSGVWQEPCSPLLTFKPFMQTLRRLTLK